MHKVIKEITAIVYRGRHQSGMENAPVECSPGSHEAGFRNSFGRAGVLTLDQRMMNDNVATVRIDKWLWAIRAYKSRSLAAEACRAGKVEIGGQPVKPSREIRVNEMVTARMEAITRTFKVIGLIENRVGAALVKQFAEDLTPASEYEKQRQLTREKAAVRPKGLGRPTKRDRRILESWRSKTYGFPDAT